MNRTTSIPETVTLHVPFRLVKRGGRKEMQMPESVPQQRTDSTLVKALARAFRYQRMLDDGRYASISEMAAAEKLDRGYLGRLLQLTLLAPDIVEAIVEGRQAEDVTLPRLMEPFPATWERGGR